ncbi:692_t:CDS:1, partial [Ambispora leptoticha]
MSKLRQNKTTGSTFLNTNEELILKKINVPSPYDISLAQVLLNFEQAVDDTINIPKKPPNSFILYRKAFYHTLISNNIRLCASKVSKIASKKWKAESSAIKKEYERIADEIRECSPKCLYSRKRSKDKYKWHIYNNNSDFLKRNKTCKLGKINSNQKSSTRNRSTSGAQDSASFLLANENVKTFIPSTPTETVNQEFAAFRLFNKNLATYNNDRQFS